MKRVITAVLLITLLPVNAQEQRPYFSLNTNRTFAPGEKPAVQMWANNVTSLDFRVYRVKDPVAFFQRLENPHQFGEGEAPPEKKETTWIERFHGFKRRVRTRVRNAFRVQYTTDTRAAIRDWIAERDRKPAATTKGAQYPTGVPLLNSQQVVATWRQEITTKQRWESQAVPINVTDKGVYLVEAVSGEYRAYTIVMITGMAVITKTSPGQIVAFAVDRQNGQPVQNVPMVVWSKKKEIARVSSDTDGLATIPLTDADPGNPLVLARKGDDFVVNAMYAWNLGSDPMRFSTGYVYTDRPIYRPGHVVHWKSIMRAQTARGLALPSLQQMNVEISDPEGNNVHRGQVNVSAMGTASGDFTIPAAAALGYYSLELSSGESHFYGGFHVEEYRKPEYEVRVTPDQLRLLQGEPVRATISARYFFGEPVSGAKVTYVVHRSRYWPSFWGEEEEEFQPEGEGDYGGEQEQVLEQTGTLDADGKLQITVPTEVSPQSWDMRYRVEARVTDASNREISGSVSVVATHGSYVVNVEPGSYVYEAGQRAGFRVETRDHDGKPVSAAVKLHLERTWPERTAPLPQDTQVQTDANGVASAEFLIREPGSFRITASAATPEKREVQSQTWVWVTGPGGSWGGSRQRLTIVPDKKTYRPGDTARVLIVTGAANARVLVTTEGNAMYTRRVVHASSPAISVDVPVRAEYSPNFFVSAVFVKDNQLFEGSKSIKVPADEKRLQVEVTPSKPEFKPGEPAVYTVMARDAAGKPARAEVSLGVVDEAIYAIRPDSGRDIFSFFYGNIGNRVGTSSSMSFFFHGEAGKRVMPLAQFGSRRSAQLKPEALVQPKVRKAFPDTVFWAASLTTDGNGRAQARFEFPDSLTTWRATARAITTESAVGAAVNKTIVRKNLILRLSTPRFFTQGDEVTISGLVHNYLKTEKTARVSLDVTGAEIIEGSTKDVAIASNGDAVVNWRLRVSNVREAKLLGKALTDEESDAMELTLPVNPFGVKLAESKAGSIPDSSTAAETEITFPSEIEPSSRTLEIGVSPSVGGAVFGALEFLTTFPYGCTEQTMSSFLPNIIVSQALRDLKIPSKVDPADLLKKVRAGLDRLYEFQHEDGGWGWWQSDESHPFMTAYVVAGIAQAKAAGYTVNEEAMNRGRDWLRTQLLNTSAKLTPDQRAYMAYAIVETGSKDKAVLDAAWNVRAQFTPYGSALIGLALQTAGDARAAEVAGTLESTVKQDERDAYWQTDRDDLLEFRGDASAEATAYALKFLTRAKPGSPLLEKAAFWLVSHRDQGYYWQSTKQTANVVFGLTEYLRASKELNPDYALTVTLNGKQVLSRRFTAQDALATTPPVLRFNPQDLDASANRIRITKSGSGRLYWSARGEYYSTAAKLNQTGSASLNLAREYFKVVPEQQGGKIVHRLDPVGADPVFAPGDVVAVKLDITGGAWNYLLIEDPIPAGAEGIPKDDLYTLKERPQWWQWSFSRREFRDDRTALFQTWLNKGEAHHFYLIKIVNPGKYRVSPARVQPMYQPQYLATSDSRTVEVR